MSRIGRNPIVIPAGVTITIKEDNTVTVKGQKGELTRKLSPNLTIEQEEGVVTVKRPDDSKENRSLHGLTRTLINNMVIGVTQGYSKTLEMVGVGYKATLQGKKLVLDVRYSHLVEVNEVPGITFEVPSPTKIVVSGINKEVVGEVAANIRKYRVPEPYKGKGIKYEGEVIRRKEGKTGK